MLRQFFIAGCLVGAGMAQAETVGFSLAITPAGNGNPAVSFTNISDVAQIVGGSLTLGDTAWNFDCVENVVAPAGGSLSFSTPEVDVCFPGGGDRPDTILFTAAGFDPGETGGFTSDIDPDFTDALANFEESLIPGGSFTATFSGGFIDGPLSVALDQPDGEGYSYTVAAESAPSEVPLPATGVLVVAGLGTLAAFRRHRR